MSTSISYSYLLKEISDCELPKEETLNILPQNQQIDILKFFYEKQRKLLNKLLESKKNEQDITDIPNIQPPKRDKTDFTPHLEANNIKESITWSQLGYTARENDNEEHFAISNFSSFEASTSSNNIIVSRDEDDELFDSPSDTACTTTFSSDEEISKNNFSQSDKISNRTRQKYNINSENSLPKRITKKDTLLPSSLVNENRKFSKTNINSKFNDRTRLSKVRI
ncbi:23569_t:CDS:2 [Cetraspora pellucida]|uniref:23569_t:CDS:1 n=1 Tax=Cetraspora pellucida TaxID=1433469 RepID=A0A9N9N2T7_9GLOM|nr:23569_t:CDS:2 [Cetraspora pellucida]